MKKIIFLFTFLAYLVAIQAQTGTIVDMPNTFTLKSPDGDTVSIIKQHVVAIERANNEEVRLLTTVKRYTLDRTDYGYSTSDSLRNFLDIITGKHYYESYHSTGGNDDTINYSYISATDTTILRLDAFAYPSDSVTTKTVVPQ